MRDTKLTTVAGLNPEEVIKAGPRVNPVLDDNMPTLTEYLTSKKDILIIRAQGGVGDIINSRMVFEDLKKLAKKMRIVYAVPKQYIPLLIDHPYIDEVINYEEIDINRYAFRRDITNKCGNYETSVMPLVDKHRADIWANYIGLELKHHRSHITFTAEEKDWAKRFMATYGKKKLKIAISPISAHFSKDWPLDKWQKLINSISRARSCDIFCYHDKRGVKLDNVTHVQGLTLREWMSTVNECDIVITVATAMFCLANALHKPTVAIFGCEDLDIYGKYFPEMIPVQRHRDRSGPEWKNCPCWSGWKGCPLNGTGEHTPKCLTDINHNEVMEAVRKLL